MTIPLILASASPRRRQLLARLGLPYTVAVAPVNEDAIQQCYTGPSEGLAQWLAEQKAISALTLPEAEHALVITADTTVILDGMVLGKPRDTTHAHELLLSLRGRWHHVVTGISVAHLHNAQPELRSASCTTPVLIAVPAAPRRYSCVPTVRKRSLPTLLPVIHWTKPGPTEFNIQTFNRPLVSTAATSTLSAYHSVYWFAC